MTFCIRKITHAPRLADRGGLLRASDLQLTSNAQSAARSIHEEASEEAEQIIGAAKQEARAAVIRAEKETLERAALLLRRLEAQHAAYLDRAQGLLVDLLMAAFNRLVCEMPDRERIASCVKRIVQDAPANLSNALLRMHPDDVCNLPEVGWEVKPDSSLSAGSLRLEASSGEWQADFPASVEALSEAIGAFAGMREENDE